MTHVLSGIRVLEVATHVFTPIAGAVLAEWGADVIKIEHPVTGDPYRGLVTSGLRALHNGVDPAFQFANRSKKSVALDLKQHAAREALAKLVERTDVFITNLRERARVDLGIDVADVRAVNPTAIYARGTGYGPRGSGAGKAGFDSSAYFARTGMASVLTGTPGAWPVKQRPAFGDVMGGLSIAGAIAAALYHRKETGEATVIDVSLLSVGLWQIQSDVTRALLSKAPPVNADRRAVPNPLVNTYRTSDGRFIQLGMIDADKHWSNFCRVVGRPEIEHDPRFADMDARRRNVAECVDILDEVFGSRTFAGWMQTLDGLSGAWAPFATPDEILSDEQVVANDYVADVEMLDGSSIGLVTSPAQFDGEAGQPSRAPEIGEHTEDVLLDIGYTWEDLGRMKETGAII